MPARRWSTTRADAPRPVAILSPHQEHRASLEQCVERVAVDAFLLNEVDADPAQRGHVGDERLARVVIRLIKDGRNRARRRALKLRWQRRALLRGKERE